MHELARWTGAPRVFAAPIGSIPVAIVVAFADPMAGLEKGAALGRSTAGGPTLDFSSKGTQSYPGIGTVANEDIVAYDIGTGSYSLYFDDSDVGLGSAVLDGFVLLSGGELLLSVTGSFSVAGMPGGPSDTWTSSSFQMFLDGSAIGIPGGADLSGQFVLE